MTIQVISNSAVTQPADKLAADGTTEKSAPTAEKPVVQNESTESDTEETEEQDDKDLSEAEESKETEAKDESKDKPKKKGGFQRRIDKLNARIAEERARREDLERQLAEQKPAGDKPKTETTAKAEGKPRPEDFDSHEEYLDARDEWNRKLAKQELEAEQEKKRKDDQVKEWKAQQKKAWDAHTDREAEFKKSTPNYDKVIKGVADIQVSPALTQFIVESEIGPQIYYELAKDPEELERVNALAPMAAARELTLLEVRLSKTSDEKTEPKKITKAPKPLTPVGGKDGSAVKSINDPNLTQSEYEAIRRAQMKARAAF